MKTMWETYKTIIEIIKFNDKLEDLYKGTVEKALHFCQKYCRKQEMHKFVESIRNTLT